MKNQTKKEGKIFCLENFGVPQFIACVLSGLLVFQSVSPAWAHTPVRFRPTQRRPLQYPRTLTSNHWKGYELPISRVVLSNPKVFSTLPQSTAPLSSQPYAELSLQSAHVDAPSAKLAADVQSTLDAVFDQIMRENKYVEPELVTFYKEAKLLLQQSASEMKAEDLGPEGQEAFALAERVQQGGMPSAEELQQLQTQATQATDRLLSMENLPRRVAALVPLLLAAQPMLADGSSAEEPPLGLIIIVGIIIGCAAAEFLGGDR